MPLLIGIFIGFCISQIGIVKVALMIQHWVTVVVHMLGA